LPEDVDPFMCTHVVFAFAKLNQNSEISPYEWNDESTGETKGMYERTIALKELNPDLKVLIGTGGWNHGSGPFSRMVHDNKLRRNFVLSVVDFLNTHRFDGLGICFLELIFFLTNFTHTLFQIWIGNILDQEPIRNLLTNKCILF